MISYNGRTYIYIYIYIYSPSHASVLSNRLSYCSSPQVPHFHGQSGGLHQI